MKNAEIRFLKEEEFDKWDEFVETSPQGSIFSKSFWLKAVSNEFRILVCEENGKIVAGIALTSVLNKFYRSPMLTPRLGIIFEAQDEEAKYTNTISKQMEIMEALISKLPKFKQFDFTFSHNFSNFLPLIWKSFNVSLRYTYIIDDLSDVNKIFDSFQNHCKRSINKALKNNLIIDDTHSLKEFYELNKKTFARQNIGIPYSYEFLSGIDRTLIERDARKILFAKNEFGEFIASVYLVYDKKCTYYLMGGADPEYRNTGVQKLLLWEAIKFASKVSESFDFEGSMIPNIEKVFREFGGKQKIIYNVYKSDLVTEIIYRFAKKNREIVRKIFKV